MTKPDPSDEIETIRRMIESSRRDRAESGDVYIVWGVLVLIAVLCELLGHQLGWSRPWIVWPVMSVLGGGISGLRIRSRLQRARILTYASRVEGHTWMMCGLSIAVFALLGGMSRVVPPELITPAIELNIAVAIGTSGALYDNRQLKLAGLGFVAAGTISLFVGYLPSQLLFAFMIVVGYILPGLAMMRKQRLQSRP